MESQVTSRALWKCAEGGYHPRLCEQGNAPVQWKTPVAMCGLVLMPLGDPAAGLNTTED